MRRLLFPMLGLAFFAVGCHTDMWVQPRAEVQGKSDFFADQMDSRPEIPGTVAQGQAMDDPAYFTGRSGGKLLTKIPSDRAMKELDLKTYREFILRGKDRFEIFCSHCHGQLGDGQGMIAQRGLSLKRPVGNYHTDRLRQMAVGHFFDVMTHGQGVMFSMAAKLQPADRWAIASYIRTLQRSQAPLAMDKLDSTVQPIAPAEHVETQQQIDDFANRFKKESATPTQELPKP